MLLTEIDDHVKSCFGKPDREFCNPALVFLIFSPGLADETESHTVKQQDHLLSQN
jgi:hypothetical protein